MCLIDRMPDAALPHDCISIDSLKLTKKPLQRRANVDEYWVHSIFTEVPSRPSKYTTFPFEFALDDMVMSCPPISKGSKMVASFAAQIDSSQYNFMKAMDEHLRLMMSATLDKKDKINWVPIMNTQSEDGNIKVHLPFNSWGQPSLPLFKKGTKERSSIYHLTQGQKVRIVLSITNLYCIHPTESKNRTGQFQCGAMATVKYIEI